MAYKKLSNCKYCEIDFSSMGTSERANHSRWCEKNPKLAGYKSKLDDMRGQIKSHRNQFMKAKDEGMPIPDGFWLGKQGTFLNKKHTPEVIEIIRDNALKSKHRRRMKKTQEYSKLDGSIVLLDSSWEVALAKRLDILNISWIRPEPMPWTDSNGIAHNYFPDFYLVDFDLFLDPKNPRLMEMEKEKVDGILKKYKNVKFLTSIKECKEYNPTVV